MPKKGLKGSIDNSMINFYEHKDVKKLATKYHNPHYADTQINIPARIGVHLALVKRNGFSTIYQSPMTPSTISLLYIRLQNLYMSS
jgi:hypothetical protein